VCNRLIDSRRDVVAAAVAVAVVNVALSADAGNAVNAERRRTQHGVHKNAKVPFVECFVFTERGALFSSAL